MSVGGDADGPTGGAAGLDEEDVRGGGLLAGVEVEAERADVGASAGVDGHVIELDALERAEVGDGGDGTAGETGEGAIDHADEEERAVGRPSEASGLAGVVEHGGGGAGRVDADDLVGVDVGEEERGVVPAGAFGEGEVVEEGGGVHGW